MKVLILGKNSYLGKHIGLALEKESHDVFYLTHGNISDAETNVFTFDKLEEVKVNFDIIINCAVSYGKNGENCCDMIGANIIYPLKVLEWASKHNVRYFINTATSITSLVNGYTLSKNQFSEWGKYYSEHNPIQFVNIVLEHFLGAHCSDNNFISMLVHKMSENVESIDLTSGMQLRDFIYIDDVVEAYLCVIHHLYMIYDRYFEIALGSGVPYRIREVCELIKKMTNSTTQLRFGYLPYREHEIMYSCADNTQLRKWGWLPKVTFEDAIRLIIEKENLK